MLCLLDFAVPWKDIHEQHASGTYMHTLLPNSTDLIIHLGCLLVMWYVTKLRKKWKTVVKIQWKSTMSSYFSEKSWEKYMKQREHKLQRSRLKPPPMVNCRELCLFTPERWKAESLLSQWHKPWIGRYPTSFPTHLMPEMCYKVILLSFFKQEIQNLNRQNSGNAAVFCVQMKTPLAEKIKGLGSVYLANCLPVKPWKSITAVI